jgi:hypothetical protein
VRRRLISASNSFMAGKPIVVNGSGPAHFFVQTESIVRAESGGVSFFTFQPCHAAARPGLSRGRIVAELDPTTFTVMNLIALQGRRCRISVPRCNSGAWIGTS